ncbi:MAG: DUF3108 domain-containing protein [Janthinobacterium lividum]
MFAAGDKFKARGDYRLKSFVKPFLLALSFFPAAFAQKEGVPPLQAPLVAPPMPGYSFPQHQTLTFTVDWRVFTAGRAVFQLDAQPGLMKVQATADTVGATNMIYQVVDRFQSSFNPQTGCSAGFSKQTQEGRRRISSDLIFAPGASASAPNASAPVLGTQSLTERNLMKNTTKQQQGQIPACVIDSLSGIFYIGSQNLTVGQDFKMPLADAMRTVSVTMKVEAREEVKTPAGTFSAIRVQPTADAGVVKNRGTITIWYSDDARHIPVQIRAKLLWGTITFHLQSIESR